MLKLVVAKCDNSYLPDFLCGRWSFGVVLYEIFTMGKYFINIFIALRLKSGGSKGGWHYPLDKYRLLHVKSLISF